jgi:RNA polymerase sigma-70 factor (ECF subfamily)
MPLTLWRPRRGRVKNAPALSRGEPVSKGMDIDVVVRAQGGDQEAFATLATGSGRRMNALALGILRDRDLAEDAVQQALVAIWKDLPRLREPAKFESWSYKLLVRICYAEARKRRRRMPEAFGIVTREPIARDDYGAVADRDQLRRGFETLSAEHRAVVVLHHYFDMPLEAVAQVLDVPAGTARSRFHRAMKSLRAALEADDRPPTGKSPVAEMQGVPK